MTATDAAIPPADRPDHHPINQGALDSTTPAEPSGSIEATIPLGEAFAQAFSKAPIPMAMVSAGEGTPAQLIAANSALCGFLAVPTDGAGWRSASASAGSDPDTLHAELGRTILQRAGVEQVIRGAGGQEFSAERAFPRIPGPLLWGVVSLTPVVDLGTHEGVWLLVVQDATARHRAEDALAHSATHDRVTDLPNRARLLDTLELTLVEDRRLGRRTCLVVLDLDDFKAVNSSLGRDGGDRYLRGVGDSLVGLMGPRDTVAHLGSDEFALVAAGLADETAARAIADDIRKRLGDEGVSVNGVRVSAAASVGVALALDSSTPQQMLSEAEAAVRTSKTQGGNRWTFAAGASAREEARILELETDMRAALADDGFTLLYQPILDIASGRGVVEVEALLRWQHPTKGQIMPGDFIEVAERRNLMPQLGEWVLREACRQASVWRATREGDCPTMCVNVSIKQLRAGFARSVLDTLAAHDLEQSALVIEVTESQILGADSTAAAELQTLADQGIALAIDDFGTGHAGFGYLRRLSPQILKIDKSFVDHIATNATDRAVLRSIVSLGENLGLAVVAEGVETDAQLQVLRASGCQFGQGWLWKPALRPDDIAPLFGLPTDSLLAPAPAPEGTIPGASLAGQATASA